MFILKQLRRKKNISQTDLAQAIGVSLRTIQLYEKKEANIPIKNLTKLATYFNLSIAELYMHEVNDAEGQYLSSNHLSNKGQQLRQVGIGKFLVTVPLVSAEQQKAYALQSGEAEFLSQLSRIGFVVETVENSEYMAFEITNNSMDNGLIEGIPYKSIVLGRKVSASELQNELKAKPNAPWVLVGKETIMCKNIAGYNQEDGILTCHSLNNSPEYADFNISLTAVDELFRVVKKQMN